MRVRVPEYLRITKLDDQLVILDGRKNQYFAVNASGSAFIQFLQNGYSVNEAIHKLEARYPLGTVRKDMEQFLKELISQGLVEET
ncbi:PqqD family protein [Laceyella tengchongensis]|uniref:PqqD family protein n=1 Tax=Laceyella tengchongensis TaxID=574699 RepID=UPI0012B84161|nr:PqqD family peptide modification chaperone [Laceyella tengchongensis]